VLVFNEQYCNIVTDNLTCISIQEPGRESEFVVTFKYFIQPAMNDEKAMFVEWKKALVEM
jgi:hypothetical protein